MASTRSPHHWLKPTPKGLYCEPADFFIDPVLPVDRAVITHGHGDHARADNRHVLATRETLAIMKRRLGEAAGGTLQTLGYGEALALGGVALTLIPAGHVLGSAQVVLENQGCRVVVSGDYKRRPDPTCAAFGLARCDLFVTEATFGLPVFRHPPDEQEIAKLLHSLRVFPERAHVIGVYALGKCQRVLALLRRAGYDAPVYLHGALQPLCALYGEHGVALGPLKAAIGATREELAGSIVLAPPSALGDVWSRRMPDPVIALASGWMRVKQRAKQRGVELPLVISDHADWDELDRTMSEVEAGEIWVTHGAEEALVRQAQLKGLRARALSLRGFEDEAE
jgi:putative mRNA 3-end processing factor